MPLPYNTSREEIINILQNGEIKLYDNLFELVLLHLKEDEENEGLIAELEDDNEALTTFKEDVEIEAAKWDVTLSEAIDKIKALGDFPDETTIELITDKIETVIKDLNQLL